jgi:NIMA (never in mitosis gene a)-related kinase
MSPEQIHEQGYDEKTDIWSTGCVLYEMVALKPPFKANSPLALATKIVSATIERIPERYSEPLQELIEWMLQINPMKRPSAADLIAHPIVAVRL